MRRPILPRGRRWTAIVVAVVALLVLAGAFALVGLWRQHSGGASGSSGGVAVSPGHGSSTKSLSLNADRLAAGQADAAAFGTNASAVGYSGGAPSAAPQPTGNAASVNYTKAVLPSEHGRYLVRNGQLSVELPRGTLAATVHSVTVLTAAYSGYVLSSAVGELPPGQTYPMPLEGQASGDQTSTKGMPTVSTGSGTPYAWMTVRVPAEHFDQAVSRFASFGKVQELTTSSDDVTGQVVDLQARLSHYKAVLARLLTFLNKADTVGSALAVQDRIDQTQLTVEQLTAELKQLKETVTFSTIDLSLAEKPSKHAGHAAAGTGFWGSIGHSAWLIGQGAKATLFALGVALPFIALVAAVLAVVAFGARTARRRRTNHTGGSAPQGPPAADAGV